MPVQLLPDPPKLTDGEARGKSWEEWAVQVNELVDLLLTSGGGGGGTYRVLLSSLEAVTTTIFGDSYGKGGPGADDGTRFSDRVALRQRTATTTNYAVSGYRSDQTLAAVTASWTPNTRGLVFLTDVVLNDILSLADGNKVTTAAAFRAILARFTAWSIQGATSSSLVYGPGWTAGVADGIAGRYVDVAWNGDACHVLVGCVTTTGATVTVTNPTTGATAATMTTGGYAQTFNGVLKLSGYGTGNHTVRVSVSAAASILGVIIPAPAPPTIVWFKPGAILLNASALNPLRLSYLAACATVAADFPSVIPVDVDSGWDTATMLWTDGTHPNDRGHAYIASLIEAALAGVGFRQGLNQLTAVNAGTYTAPTASYSTSGATVPAAPTGVSATAANQAAISWVRGNDGGATVTSQVIQVSYDAGSSWADAATAAATDTTYTITSGLTTGATATFRVLAVNSVGRGTASTASGSITIPTPATVYSADTFTRADSTSAPGTTETGGYAWTTPTGVVYGISSNRLYSVTVPSTGVQPLGGECYIDDGQALGTFSATILTLGKGSGIVFNRDTSGGAYIFFDGGAKYTLSTRTSTGTYTTLVTTGQTPVVGDVITVVKGAAGAITLKVNGTTVGTATNTTYAGTKHGFYAAGSSPNNFVDNWQHTS